MALWLHNSLYNAYAYISTTLVASTIQKGYEKNSSWLFARAGMKGKPSIKYFDKSRKIKYRIGDVLYKPGHIVLVIENGENPEIAEATSHKGERDGTKKWKLSSRWGSWQPTNSGRYFFSYSHQLLR